jgi:hypothetical protein
VIFEAALCLGLLDVYSWARAPGSLGQDKDPSRALEEKESVRWVDGSTVRRCLAETAVLAEMEFDQPSGNGRTARTVHQQLKTARVTLKAPRCPAMRYSTRTNGRRSIWLPDVGLLPTRHLPWTR